jgi:VanZ like family
MENVPWFWPGLVVSGLLGVLLSERVARRFQTSRGVAWVLVAAVGLIISAALTPLRGADVPTWSGGCDFSRLWFPPVDRLVGINDTSLNVLLFIPLGLALAALPTSRNKAILLLAAIAAPFAIEAIQAWTPILARGCESADVVDNLSGLVLGLAAAATVRRLWPGRRPDQASSESTRSR